MKRKLILASASPRRKEILEQMGLMFTVSPCSVSKSCKGVRPHVS